MKCHFKNIGMIKEASVELGDLTILAGPNNTGKTYIAYTLYGFFKTCTNYFPLTDEIKKVISDLTDKGHSNLNLLNLDYKKIFSMMASRYSKKLHEIFSAREEEFNNAEFSIEINDPLTILANMSKNERQSKGHFGEVVLLVKLYFLEDIPYVSFTYEKLVPSKNFIPPPDFILHGLAPIITSIFFKSFICVSERLAIPLFYRELDTQKIALVEQLQKLATVSKEDSFLSLFEMFDKINTRYALPIKDYIDFIRSIPEIIKQDSSQDIAELYKYIVAMTGGIYRYQSTEGLVFASKPHSRTKFSLTTNLWSSSIKSLSGIFFYLKHMAWPGQLLIIDEPEIHLTPQNQIILARLLAACVNKGLKVLITTHSDYLIKEFNNLIMLHNLSENDRSKFINSNKPHYTTNEALNPEKVKAYICHKGGMTACKMDQYGIEVTSMDDAINSINNAANDLVALMESCDSSSVNLPT